ncbi:hypothetical protein SUDANB145_04974 [Streptomyces sp. enrichment culture]
MENAPQHAASAPEAAEAAEAAVSGTVADGIPGADDTAAKKALCEAPTSSASVSRTPKPASRPVRAARRLRQGGGVARTRRCRARQPPGRLPRGPGPRLATSRGRRTRHRRRPRQGRRDPLRTLALVEAAASRPRPRRPPVCTHIEAWLGRSVRLTPHRTTARLMPSAAWFGPSRFPALVAALRTRPGGEDASLIHARHEGLLNAPLTFHPLGRPFSRFSGRQSYIRRAATSCLASFAPRRIRTAATVCSSFHE